MVKVVNSYSITNDIHIIVTESDDEEVRELTRRKQAKEFTRILKQLDVDAFLKFCDECCLHWAITSRVVALASMHKLRLNRVDRKRFTDGERRLSKRWLKEHGYTAEMDFRELSEEDKDIVFPARSTTICR